jgi:glutaredoxin-like protein NrdH
MKWLDAGERLCENDGVRSRFGSLGAPGRKQRKGMAVQQETVKMYTLSTCSHCRAAKNFMKSLGVQYEYVDVDLLSGAARAAAFEEVRKLNPLCSFPTILIGDTVIVGNREDKIREALGIS